MATYQRPCLDLLVKENWYVGGVSDKRAEGILTAMPVDRGNFIVRDSLLPDADYVLSVREGNEIWNYNICIKPNDECILYKYIFPDLSTAIAFYSENRLGPVYLKPLNEPLISDVQPASPCAIKMASTVSPPRHFIIAPQNKNESESSLSPKLLALCREVSDCNASTISANSVDQHQDVHQLATEDLGDPPLINGRLNNETTLDEVVTTAHPTFDAITGSVQPAAETEETLANGTLSSPVEPSSCAGQRLSFPDELNALETVVEVDSSRGPSNSNSETNLNNCHHLEDTRSKETADDQLSIKETAGDQLSSKETADDQLSIKETADDQISSKETADDQLSSKETADDQLSSKETADDQLSSKETADDQLSSKETADNQQRSISEGDRWEEGDIRHSNSTEGGPGEEANAHQMSTEEVEQVNQGEGGISNEASRMKLDLGMTGNSVVKLASSLQTVLAPSSLRGQLTGRKSKFVSSRSKCLDGIQISQGPVPIMAGATGTVPSLPPPIVRSVKPRSISPDDMDLIAGPINTKRSGKKLKRNKSMFERSEK